MAFKTGAVPGRDESVSTPHAGHEADGRLAGGLPAWWALHLVGPTLPGQQEERHRCLACWDCFPYSVHGILLAKAP